MTKPKKQPDPEVQLNARIPQSLHERAKQEAEKSDLSLAQFIRRALTHECDRALAARSGDYSR